MIVDEELCRAFVDHDWEMKSFDRALEKATDAQGLSLADTSVLFRGLNGDTIAKAKSIARDVRIQIKGPRAALYTCSYVTNECVNNCGYCGFRRSNKSLQRITLSSDEIRSESRAIRESGVTNSILIGGTLPEERYRKLIIEGTEITLEEGLFPWIEFENLSLDTLESLSDIGANHFVLFQETYDKKRYENAHKDSPLKSDYNKRLAMPDHAFNAGFDNIGIGALFGLTSDYVFELLGLYQHTHHLWTKGARVCVSVPTLKPAPELNIDEDRVGASDIERIVTTLRLALPKASIALSGRESAFFRNELFGIVDQVGSGGAPNPGGRTVYSGEYDKGDTQFKLFDDRTPGEVTSYLDSQGIAVVPKVSWG